MEDSGLKGEVDSWDLGPDSTEVHLGPNLKNRPEDSVPTPLAVEGFVQYAGKEPVERQRSRRVKRNGQMQGARNPQEERRT
jgi:hypothetical protein